VSSPDEHPVQVLGLSGVTQVAENSVAAYALTSSATVKAWGYDFNAALGASLDYPWPQQPLAIPPVSATAVASDQGSAEDSSTVTTGFAATAGSRSSADVARR
jgi:hypothetical protein